MFWLFVNIQKTNFSDICLFERTFQAANSSFFFKLLFVHNLNLMNDFNGRYLEFFWWAINDYFIETLVDGI